MTKIRLDKLLSSQTTETRGDIKKSILRYGVLVNDKLTKDPGMIVESEKDQIVFRGQEIGFKEYIYIMLNKPAGVVSAVTDERDRTVVDLIRESFPRKDYFPIGRLDKDTEGLLVISNDGILAHNLLSPRKHIPKKYYVEIQGILTEADIVSLSEGVVLDDGYQTKESEVELVRRDKDQEKTYIYLTISEGKFHQVKRMIKAVGHEVKYLKRVQMGKLALDENLKPGEFRELSAEELQQLRGE